MNIQSIHNRYELKQRLGSGTMGSVYRAYDRLTGEEVALKLVSQTHDVTTVNPTTANLALAHEFQVLASLRHPNIINVLDYGFYNKTTPYFTMAFVHDANNLRMAAGRQLLIQRVMLIIQLLNALVYLERRDIVHRDLKPDNVLVTPEQVVKVVDFGLARDHLTNEPHEIGGTIAYIAPEIFQNGAPSHQADLYAVGVIAYEILSQQPLYPSDASVNEVVQRAVSVAPDFKPFLTQVSALLSPRQSSAEEATPSPDAPYQPTTTVSPHSETRPFMPDEMPQRDPQSDTRVSIEGTRTDDFFAYPLHDSQASASAVIEGDEPAFKLARVVQKLLAKKPQDRYQRAEEVINDLFRAIDVPPLPQTAAIQESFLQAARFIGRETEFKELSEGLERAIDAQGGLYFIGGESGVGKSRLLNELSHLALVKGMLVLNGQAVREGSLLYQPWREAIRRLTLHGPMPREDAQSLKPIIPDLERLLGEAVPESDSDENAVQRITTALLNLFRSYREPILLLLEDWQWAHAESREALKRLHNYAMGARLFIVVSYRNDEAPDLPEQYPGSTTLLLDRLNATHVHELASSILGQRTFRSEFIGTLQRHTEGNVFFLIEAIRALAEEAGRLEDVVNVTLPESLITGGMTQVVQRRIDKVPSRYRPMLEAAAVAGRELNLKLLRALNDSSVDFEDWLTTVANAAVVEYRDEIWRFSHDKLRQHLLTQIDEATQQRLHRQIAEKIEALYSADEQAAVLVTHWRGANEPEKELHYIRIAGEQATRYNVYDEARQLYARALTLTTQPLLVMEFNNLLGGVYEYLSQYEQALKTLDIVLALAREHNQPTALAEAEHKLAWIHMRQGDMAEAHRHASEALTMAREATHTLLTIRALNALGVIYVIQGDNSQSRAHLEQALPLIKTINDDYLHASILNTLGAAYEGEGRVEEAIKTLNQAGQMAEALRDRELLANVHGNLGRILYIQKQFGQAKESFNKALPGFSEVGNLYGEALANDYLGLIALQHGELQTARPYLKEGIRTSLMIGAQTVALLGLCGVAWLYVRLRQPQRASELMGMIRANEASTGDIDVQRESQRVIDLMFLSDAELQAAIEHGGRLKFDEVVTHEVENL